MVGITTRNMFINNDIANDEDDEIRQIFDYILNTDMEYKPDPDIDLTYDTLKENPVIRYWVKKYAEKTQMNYITHIEQYLLFHMMTPEQMACEALNDDDTIIMMRKYIQRINIFNDLISDIEYGAPLEDGTIKRSEYSNNTKIVKLAAVKSFYAKFGIDIPKKALDQHIANSPLPKNEEIPTKEEIKYALDKSKTELMKCLILGQTSSGMAGVDLLNVSIGQYLDGKITVKKAVKDKDNNEKLVDVELCRMVIQRQKNQWRGGHKFIAFFSPECCQQIDRYLESRNKTPRPSHRNKTTVKKAYQKRRYDIDIENGKSEYNIPLFVPTKISDKFLKDRDESIRKLSTDTMQNMYRDLANACGKSNKQYEFGLIRSQNMREYCSYTLENETNRPLFVRHIMGHKSGTVENAYYKKHEKALTDFYIEECLPLLQFTETEAIKLVTDKVLRLEKLEKEALQYEEQMQQRDQREAEILDRLKRLETRDQYHNAMDMLRGEETTYEDENGETVTEVITDENNYPMRYLKKIIDMMNTDESFDPSELSAEEIEAIIGDEA